MSESDIENKGKLLKTYKIPKRFADRIKHIRMMRDINYKNLQRLMKAHTELSVEIEKDWDSIWADIFEEMKIPNKYKEPACQSVIDHVDPNNPVMKVYEREKD